MLEGEMNARGGGVYPDSSNIGILRGNVGEHDVDEETGSTESFCVDCCAGVG